MNLVDANNLPCFTKILPKLDFIPLCVYECVGVFRVLFL